MCASRRDEKMYFDYRQIGLKFSVLGSLAHTMKVSADDRQA
jgi:hypothetical protein